jgi:hypothetical protein
MTDTIEIYLNSKSANKQNNGTSDVLFHLPPIEVRKDEKAYVNVKQAVIPFSFYNVNETNNLLNFSIETSHQSFNTYSISIPFGNYNINQLISYLNSQFLLLPANDKHFTITYSVQTNKLTLKHLHHNFQLLSSSTCFELLGFKENETQYGSLLTGTIYNLTSVFGINLFVVRQIYIASNNFILNNINASNPNDSNILASVSVTGNPNSIIHYENTTSRHLIHHLNNVTNLQIKLLDQDGDSLNLNGVNWSITLELIIVKNNI